MRKVILRNGQSPGDILMMTVAVKELKETFPEYQVDIRTPCPEIWENNPRLTPLAEGDSGVEVIDIGYPAINQSGLLGFHFGEAFIRNVEDKLKVTLRRTGLRPEIWLTEDEKAWINQVAVDCGYKGKFWLIQAGYKPDCPLKAYPYYQEVVDILKDKIQFVQIGHESHIHPKLSGVFNLVGKTDLRQLIRLMWWAEGTVGPISFHMVAMAAYQKPCVVIAGGKEPLRWQAYPNHRYLNTNGALECCAWDGCWKSKLEDCTSLVGGKPRCFSLIRPEDVARAIEMYYLGGMLKY